VVAAIPPKIAVAQFIGQIKGVTSTRFNKSGGRDLPLRWQEEYGVFSFDSKRLPCYVAYVEGQKKHHAQGELLPILERTTDSGVKLIREPVVEYAAPCDDWWQAMMTLE
jgi:putative transposase